MCELLSQGKVIFTGTYAQCVMKRAELNKCEWMQIRESTIDADGFTGYSL